MVLKCGGGNVMMWGCITGLSVGPLLDIEGFIKCGDYIVRYLSPQLGNLINQHTEVVPDYVVNISNNNSYQ